MISVDLARELRDAGLTWTPARGDRFIVMDRQMDGEVFVLSDMTIELHDLPGGPVFGFNGTTEWALDSLEQRDALWLPAEHQLRDRLGATFDRLERVEGGYRVHTRPRSAGGNGAVRGTAYDAADPADAYGLAVLGAIRAIPGAKGPGRAAE